MGEPLHFGFEHKQHRVFRNVPTMDFSRLVHQHPFKILTIIIFPVAFIQGSVHHQKGTKNIYPL